jgi:4-hydroxybenzoate polyprenyltransferase
MRAVLPLLRSCSVRFTAYYWVGFAAGLASAGRLDLRWALLGVPMWLCYCLGTEAVNRIADRDADVVNRPERTALCQEFGWRRMAWAAVLSWVGFVAFGAALTWAHPGLPLVAILLVDVGVAIGYSIGPAFKRHRVLSLVALTAPLVTPLVTGWAVQGTAKEFLSPVLPIATVLVTFSFGLAGIKDITDVEGDREIGYSSLWLVLARVRRGLAVRGLVCAPFLLVAVYVTGSALPLCALGLLVLAPASLMVVTAASRARVPADREAAREVMHQYTFYFLTVALLAACPHPAMAAATAAAVGYWLLASRLLHWSGGLTAAHIRRWTALFVVPTGKKEFS